MSELPNPPQGTLDYAAMYMQNQRQRPLSVSIIAIITIIVACLALLGLLLGTPSYFIGKSGANPVVDQVRASHFLMGWMVVTSVVGFVVHILQLWAAINALKLVKRTRKILIGIAIYSIVMGLIGSAIMLPITINALDQQALAAGPGAPMLRQITITFMVIGILVSNALPICTIIFFRKRHVIEAFEQSGL